MSAVVLTSDRAQASGLPPLAGMLVQNPRDEKRRSTRCDRKAIRPTNSSNSSTGNTLGPLVQNVVDDPAYFYLTSPGIRNVHSAASLLARSLMFGINEHLIQQALPTFIHKPLTRLASGSADDTTLDAASRRNRDRPTKTLLPVSDFEEQPIHVLFIDDAWVTGTTARTAHDRALAAVTRSCHQLVAIKVDEEVAKEDSAIEDRLNRFVIHGVSTPMLRNHQPPSVRARAAPTALSAPPPKPRRPRRIL